MACLSALGLMASKSAAATEILFNRDIRPILSENCFHCHGPDSGTREAELGLHNADLAKAVIKPGQPDESELVARIFDEDQPMPPASSNRRISDTQKKMLRQWIAEGAEYQAHWAFIPPKKISPFFRSPNQKANRDAFRRVNPIDDFIQTRLGQERLKPAAEAKPEVLARRVSLALTGLQPTPAEMKQVLSDQRKDAYERFVDRLLGSEAYAERMALFWLDAARYADTDGYQNDAQRTNWPWRDWVIGAYRDNMPFDQFTIEQLAGDMLPEATPSQRLATTFNRNHRQNGESGALSDEFFVENVIDRVETTSTVWLGLTTGCARCHDHKYDPISQREFYQLFAYFNNIGEQGIGKGIKANPLMTSASPIRKIPTELAEKKHVAESELAVARQSLLERMKSWASDYQSNERPANDAWLSFEEGQRVTVISDNQKQVLRPNSDQDYLFDRYSSDSVVYQFEMVLGNKGITGIRLDIFPSTRHSNTPRFAPSANGNFVVTNLSAEVIFNAQKKVPLEIIQVSASYEQQGYAAANTIDQDRDTGWAVSGADPRQPIQLLLQFKEPISKSAGGKLRLSIYQNSRFANHTIGQLRISYSTLEKPLGPPEEVVAALQLPVEKWDDAATKLVRDYYESIDPVVHQAVQNQQTVERAIQQGGYVKTTVMVMQEQETEYPTYLLNRGQYDDPDKSEILSRSVPEALLGNRPAPSNRLALAKWLVSRENPLTARVIVNRMWQRMFGVGLVKTSEDFGSQGERPSHPELLDWLAVEFMDSGWDVQHVLKLIVTSHTFRQSSRASKEQYATDPENRLLARGPRFRMDGFALRDMALQSAGLLNREIGGPPVKPYQPAGLWSAVGNSPNDRYQQDQGKKLYRKSMYTYWRRAVNPPLQTIFDASGREVCNVRHRVTNTPLQALALMNDVTFVEAARHLGERMSKPKGLTTRQRLARGYTLATSYSPDSDTLDVLEENFKFFMSHYDKHKSEAEEFLSIGDSTRDISLNPVSHAAYSATAHLMLNLDETIVLE